MKLLIIFPATQRGGAEEYVLKIARAALQQNWVIHTAFPRTCDTISLIDDFTRQGIEYHQLDIAEVEASKLVSVKTSLLRLIATYQVISQIQPDVVLLNLPAHHLGFTIVWLCGLLQIPTAVVFHLIPFSAHFNNLKLKAYHWAKARKQQWITISDYNRRSLGREFALDPQEFHCIYNGIQIEVPQASLEPERLRLKIRQELDLPANSKLLLTVARLHPQKGHDYLIPVIPQIVAKFPDVHFVWVGDGDRQEYLTDLLEEYRVAEKVTFLGYRDDIPNLLTAADLFVFPSYQEGMPFAILEATIYGLPIVASDTGGIPEIIVDRQHGLLFQTGDRQALLEKLYFALSNPQIMAEMSKSAKTRVQSFSAAQMTTKTLKILQDLAFA